MLTDSYISLWSPIFPDNLLFHRSVIGSCSILQTDGTTLPISMLANLVNVEMTFSPALVLHRKICDWDHLGIIHSCVNNYVNQELNVVYFYSIRNLPALTRLSVQRTKLSNLERLKLLLSCDQLGSLKELNLSYCDVLQIPDRLISRAFIFITKYTILMLILYLYI